MGQIEDRMMAFLRENLPRAMQQASERQVELLRDKISVPWPPSGPTGRPEGYPALRKGLLRDGLGASTKAGENEVVSTIFSNRAPGYPHVPSILENGRGRMEPRPYMGMAKDPGLTESGYLSDVGEALLDAMKP